MIKAIINILNAIADRIRPCKHDWKLVHDTKVTKTYRHLSDYYYSELYVCKNCGMHKRISDKNL